jgi:V/A-type H+-transporting ATPase subunit I
MLIPRKMKKVRIYSVKQNEEAILSALHDLGIFQVEPVSLSSDLISSLPQTESYAKLSELSRKVRDLEMSLYPNETDEKRLFKDVKELVSAAENIDIYERVKSLKEKEGVLLSSLKFLNERVSALDRISFYDGDLSYLNGENISSFIIKKEEGIAEKLRTLGETILLQGQSYVIAAVQKNALSKFGELAKDEKLEVVPVPIYSGKVKENLAAEELERNGKLKELNQVKEELEEISRDYFANVAAIREQLDIEMKKIDVTSKLSGTNSAIILEGWVPAEEYGMMNEALSNVTGGQIVSEEVETDEIPPTSLKNYRGTKLFEFFIRFYSLPQSVDIDPTLIFALVFPIFFGFMIGDVGYGVTILLISIWLIRRVNHPPKKSRIPKFLSRFVMTMMKPRSLRVLAKAMLPGAIIAIALGILFDDYFGFSLPYPHFALISSFGIKKLLLLSGYVGVAMVSLGLLFGFVINYVHGHRKEAIGKVGWLMVAYGIVILGLEVIRNSTSGLNPVITKIDFLAYPLLFAGLGVVVYAEKAQALIEVTTIISHILSYTRLVGILLSSAILALVFDDIFLSTLHHSILFLIFGFVILIIGQMLNLVIAIFEPGIQGARLIYVEFFSKFYKGNGREFRPFSSPRNYTIRQFSLEPLVQKGKK